MRAGLVGLVFQLRHYYMQWMEKLFSFWMAEQMCGLKRGLYIMRCIASCFWKLFWAKKSTTLHRSSTDLASLINKVERWRRGGSLQRVFGVAEKSHCGITLTSKDSCWWIQENVVGWFFKLLAPRHRGTLPIDGYRVRFCYSSSLWHYQYTIDRYGTSEHVGMQFRKDLLVTFLRIRQ